MSAELRLNYPREEGLVLKQSWSLELFVIEGEEAIVAQILWGDKDRPTGAWNVPLADLKRLIDFAQPQSV